MTHSLTQICRALSFEGVSLNLPLPTDWVVPPGIEQKVLESIRTEFFKRWHELTTSAAEQQLPTLSDRRFSSPAWSANPNYLMMAHFYLLSAESMQRMVEATDGPPELKERLRFSISQWLDAMSPANFLVTNPDAQEKLLKTSGESVVAGLNNLFEDLQKGRITQTDESKFTVGENVATTPGSVVFQNKYLQLIHYQPVTSTVYARPILLVPPCINKFYVLDLQPENSLVQHTLAQGFNVFLVSWRNPVPEDSDGIDKATWDEYLEEGVLKAIEVVRTISGQSKINTLGFCVGGTMLATALAVAASRGQEPAASLTLLTSMLDFSDTGVLNVFVDPQQVSMREKQIGQGGLMTARELSTTFSFLRPNELVWNYVVSNYLKGEKPPAFDLLYWNSDSTNLPGPFFTWYFRNTYLENNLREPGKLKCSGVPVDLSKIRIPAYLYGSKEDHIVPWKTSYLSTQVLRGEKRFVLGASGHIAGVINPPAKNKRSFWACNDSVDHASATQWFDNAVETPGSWWNDWTSWLAKHSGRKIKVSAKTGNASYPEIEPAPGSYVKVKAI